MSTRAKKAGRMDAPAGETAAEEGTGPQFEDGMRLLDGIVGKLESGKLTLEESLGVFEESVRLVRHLNALLSRVEKRLEVLSGGETSVRTDLEGEGEP